MLVKRSRQECSAVERGRAAADWGLVASLLQNLHLRFLHPSQVFHQTPDLPPQQENEKGIHLGLGAVCLDGGSARAGGKSCVSRMRHVQLEERP